MANNQFLTNVDLLIGELTDIRGMQLLLLLLFGRLGYKIPVIENLGATLVSTYVLFSLLYPLLSVLLIRCSCTTWLIHIFAQNSVIYVFRYYLKRNDFSVFWEGFLRACSHVISEQWECGCFQDQFDTLELSDNDIRKLDGFPLLRRLKCIVLNNNRVSLVALQLMLWRVLAESCSISCTLNLKHNQTKSDMVWLVHYL